MSHATVFIIIDGGRADYVTKTTMPFLHGLGQRSLHGQVETTVGYTQRTTLFTGLYPDTSGKFTQYVYDPEASPYKWTKNLGPLRSLIRPFRVLYPARLAVSAVTRWTTDTYHSDPGWIPPKLLPFFRPGEDMKALHAPGALGATSIFDLCRERNLQYRYLAHPVSGDDQEVHATLIRELRQGAPNDFYVLQYSVADQQGHLEGPFGEHLTKKHLRDLDEKFATIHAALVAGYDSWDLFVVGSHGMAPVQHKVDLLRHLKHTNAKPGTDYVVFVNSTLAIFWYLTKKGRDEIEAILPTIPRSRVVDHAERVNRRIPGGPQNGDAILAAEPGVVYSPDYLHANDTKLRGMHGYLDKSTEGNGTLIIASNNGHTPNKDLGTRPLADVFPTLCNLLGVPTPPEQEGESLLTDFQPQVVPKVETHEAKVIADV